MNFNNVLKMIDSIETNKPAQVINESKEEKAPVQLQEGFDTSALKMLSGQQSIVECGMPAMGAPIPHAPSMPATINMSAGNAHEIVSMMRGIMDLAKSDTPSMAMPQASMPAMGASLDALLPAPTGGDDVSVSHGDIDSDGDHDMDDHKAELDGPTDLDSAGDSEIMDLIKKIRTGEPVKITTDNPVKVSTDKDISGTTTGTATSSDDKPKDEEYDNTPKPETKGYNPNDFANIINKVRTADISDTPFGSGSNPMPDEEDKEKKEESIDAFEAQLFAEYKKFVSEGGKVDQNKDGKNDWEDVKIARMKAAAKAKKK